VDAMARPFLTVGLPPHAPKAHRRRRITCSLAVPTIFIITEKEFPVAHLMPPIPFSDGPASYSTTR
ncbi:MAG: hypothetical protein ACRD9Y_14625, partial [Blastocatellia bacterium]